MWSHNTGSQAITCATALWLLLTAVSQAQKYLCPQPNEVSHVTSHVTYRYVPDYSTCKPNARHNSYTC